ncbi:hypothetical protein LSA36186_22700 [Lachnoanaerobaculum sp. JCM 36186]|uniref:hypothetical protein n=1 Tax=Lachnoanaerobaculum sanguinis TaxID=3065809 RepID=UPI0027670970|nr:hypothetical protein [Lachnoanaerobaculum sp. JCM 36186]GMO04020.1 hypothetical protein LSA36186_22700 [Lachnoanaerobaculum sp. JCM 36186]
MENDFILEKDRIINEESTQKHFPWILGIIYNIVVYRWAYVIISQLNTTVKKEFEILPHIVYLFLLLIPLILQIISVNKAIKRNDINYCIDGALFYGYAMFPISLLCAICIFGVAVGEIFMLIACMVVPAMIFFVPFIAIPCIIFLMILLLLYYVLLSPGMLAAGYLVRCYKDEYGLSNNKYNRHKVFRFIPGVNLIDILYISNKYRDRGKLQAVIISVSIILMLLVIVAAIIIRIV